MTVPRVLSVGQCSFDQGRIARYLRETFGAQTQAADTADEALDALRAAPYDLVLINRILDHDGSAGLDLVRSIKADAALVPSPTMVVSNYPETQEEAVSLGALRGFGKADIGKATSRDRLAPILRLAESRGPRS